MTSQAGEARRIRRVSVVSPMLNEADHVDELVADLAAQDYDGELEVLVADGGSTTTRSRDFAPRASVTAFR